MSFSGVDINFSWGANLRNKVVWNADDTDFYDFYDDYLLLEINVQNQHKSSSQRIITAVSKIKPFGLRSRNHIRNRIHIYCSTQTASF